MARTFGLPSTLERRMSLPTIKSLLYSGCTSRIIGHLELSVSPTNKRPVDQTRWPGYDQHNAADVTAHCQRIKGLGFDVVMPNTYSVGSFENQSLLLYMPALQAAGLGLIINIDKGIYASQPNPQTAIANYLTWMRANCFTFSNYEKFGGKYLVTFFTLPTDSPAMFRSIEAANPDILFVYNDPNMGPNTMAWIQSDLTANLDWWIRTYAKTGTLQIPCFYPGFNDTLMRNAVATSVWTPPTVAARVWPAGGPNATTLQACFTTLNAHYSTTFQPPYIQGVTLNDWDELTAMECKADGTGGYFASTAPTLNHQELWVNGTKFGNLAPGNSACTIVSVYSDGSLKDNNFTYTAS
jgi:hypothetical protein